MKKVKLFLYSASATSVDPEQTHANANNQCYPLLLQNDDEMLLQKSSLRQYIKYSSTTHYTNTSSLVYFEKNSLTMAPCQADWKLKTEGKATSVDGYLSQKTKQCTPINNQIM